MIPVSPFLPLFAGEKDAGDREDDEGRERHIKRKDFLRERRGRLFSTVWREKYGKVCYNC